MSVYKHFNRFKCHLLCVPGSNGHLYTLQDQRYLTRVTDDELHHRQQIMTDYIAFLSLMMASL